MKVIKKKSLRNIFVILLAFVSIFNYSQSNSMFKDSTSLSKDVTTRYFNAYMNLDFKSMKLVMHDSITFYDPTAKLVFGGNKIKGKTKVYEYFLNSYASIIEMKQSTIRTIFSSNTGVFELNFVYKFKNGSGQIFTIDMPLIVILTIKNGKIIEHRDYADYNYFMKQYNQQLKKE